MTVYQRLPIFEGIILISERIPLIIACWVVLTGAVRKGLRIWVFLSVPILLALTAAYGVWESRQLAQQQGYDLTQPSLREALEAYVNTGKGDLEDILLSKKHAPIIGQYELSRFFGSWLMGTVVHDTNQDAKFLPEAYNKGDDWFEATLGEPMVYTSAIHNRPTDSMWSSQLTKLDFIASALGVKPGDKAMDIGCGWGRLSNHYASKGAKVTAVTMSTDQAEYARKMTEKLGNKDKVEIVLKNFFDLEYPAKTFNVISAVEMAEHVGITNYHTFLRKVHNLLADDGVFYIQVAGLPRGYAEGYNHYEDLVWGMFMDEHIFPGADASCPMGWVLTKLEQAGFEVQQSLNMGMHYMQTIGLWLKRWMSKKDEIVKAYGERSFRRWQVFLRWSIKIGGPGGSTVNFITATKSGNQAAREAVQKRLAPGVFQTPEATPCPGGGPEP